MGFRPIEIIPSLVAAFESQNNGEPVEITDLIPVYNTHMEENLRHPLLIDPPLMNAAGSLGFAPDQRTPLPWTEFGAFVTNPISLQPRRPASTTRWKEFPGGVLLHSGHPNPGFRQVISQFAPRWMQSPLPVIVHLLASRPEEIQACVLQLEVVENVSAVEIGFPHSIGGMEAAEIISAALGEIPVIACLPLDRSIELASVVEDAGAAAVSLSAPRGSLPVSESFMHGRMYGPAVFPFGLQMTAELYAMGIPVIGAGGIYQRQQVDEMLRAGALAVQVDLALWRGDWMELQEEDVP